MSKETESPLRKKQIFNEGFTQEKEKVQQPNLGAHVQFSDPEKFVLAKIEPVESESEQEHQLEQVIRPKKGPKWLASGLLAAFAGLVGWQSIDTLITAIQTADWLSLGWAAFVTAIAGLGISAIGREIWKLRKLRRHFSIQEQSELLMTHDSVGKAKTFCEALAKQGGVKQESRSYDRWINSINSSHSDAEIIDMYDAMVVAEQDKLATKIVSQHATESAALVAISPLAAADMLLVAWRNFKMIDSLAQVYGVELGYWSRLKLFKATLVNMAAAGASELAIDAGMDLMSMDLAAKVSARAGQGLGVGILTARLGLKAMSLLRPIPWHQDRKVKLGTIRKRIVEKIAAITIK